MSDARSDDGCLSAEDFRVWLRSRELTKAEAGRMLGVVYQTISGYEKNGASKTVALAVAAIERGIAPFKPTEEDRRIAGLKHEEPPHERSADTENDGQL